MKKAIVMAGALFALTMTAGCGSQNQDHAATAESDVTENEEEALQDNENTEKSSKVLVAYYSATGNTKAAAETIADAADGELFELQPAEAYTTEDLDYNDPESRVCKEHADPDLQDVKLEEVTPESFSNAEVVFLGYPIWWGEAAWPVNEFVKENDFTGKTVIPFCTSASSGAAEEEIQNWVGSLDLKKNKQESKERGIYEDYNFAGKSQ